MNPQAGRLWRILSLMDFRRHACFALVGCAALLFLSGCVYQRLLDLKRQLGNFEENFSLSTNRGISVRFLHPVLLSQDMAFIGIHAEIIEDRDDLQVWHIRWHKIVRDGFENERAPMANLSALATFDHGRLREFSLAEEFFDFVPKPLFIATLHALGHLSVNLSAKTAGTVFDPEARRSVSIVPRLSEVRRNLGVPFSETADSTSTDLEYRYAATSREKTYPPIKIHLRFRTDSEKLTVAQIAFSGGKIQLNVE